MKTLGVAGDNFLSAVQTYPKKHFTELLADHYNVELATFARSGASNTLISYQVDQLIKDKVDYIIWGSTTADGIEVKTKHQQGHPPTVFDFDYYDKDDLSALDERFSSTPSILSNSIEGFSNHESSKMANIVTKYFVKTYDWRTKADTDSWVIHSTWQRLIKSGIPFCYIPRPDLQITPKVKEILPRDSIYIVDDYPLSPHTWKFCADMPYHTSILDNEIGYGEWVNSMLLDKYLK